MQKVPKRLLAAALLAALLLSGCCVQEENTTVSPAVVAREPIPQGEISLRETDQLVIWSFMDLPYFVELYEEKYPEIQVENVVMDVNAYQKKLYEGFEEGETPDIIFLQPDLFFQKDDGETGYYEDIQQLFDSGKLLNLKRLVEEDAGFEGTECLEAAFAACEYRGGLYGIPASLDGRNFLLSGEETLKRVGYEAEQVEDAASLFRELVRVRPRAREQEGFVSMLDFPGEKKLECLFRASQVPLIDYESGTVLPEGEQLREYCDALKAFLYEDSGEPNNDFGEEYLGQFSMVIEGRTLFLGYGANPPGHALVKWGDKPVAFVFPTFAGKAGASVANLWGIPQGSANQQNAWNFIKLMLTEEGQLKCNGAPMRRSYSEEGQETLLKSASNKRGIKAFYQIEEEIGELSEEEKENIVELLTGVQECSVYSMEQYRIFKSSMTPYFTGEADYEECVEQLKEKLIAYLEG